MAVVIHAIMLVEEHVLEDVLVHVLLVAPDVLAIVQVLVVMVVRVALVRAAEVVNISVQIVQVVLEDVADVVLVAQAVLLIARMNVADVAVAQEVAVQRAQDVILLARPVAQTLVLRHARPLVSKIAMLLVAIAVKE